MPEIWMTYPALAQLWEMSQDAARTRARRGNFQRRVNNRGQTEVLVDDAAPPMRVRPPRSGRQTPSPATMPAPDAESPPSAILAALQAHIDTLKAAIAAAEAATAAERQRTADLSAQLARITADLLAARHGATRRWWQRLAG